VRPRQRMGQGCSSPSCTVPSRRFTVRANVGPNGLGQGCRLSHFSARHCPWGQGTHRWSTSSTGMPLQTFGSFRPVGGVPLDRAPGPALEFCPDCPFTRLKVLLHSIYPLSFSVPRMLLAHTSAAFQRPARLSDVGSRLQDSPFRTLKATGALRGSPSADRAKVQ